MSIENTLAEVLRAAFDQAAFRIFRFHSRPTK